MKYDDQVSVGDRKTDPFRRTPRHAEPFDGLFVLLSPLLALARPFFCADPKSPILHPNPQSLDKTPGQDPSVLVSDHVKSENKLTRAVSNILGTLSVFASRFAFALVHRS